MKSDHIKVLEKPTECTKKILEAKKNVILKMTTKLVHSAVPIHKKEDKNLIKSDRPISLLPIFW